MNVRSLFIVSRVPEALFFFLLSKCFLYCSVESIWLLLVATVKTKQFTMTSSTNKWNQRPSSMRVQSLNADFNQDACENSVAELMGDMACLNKLTNDYEATSLWVSNCRNYLCPQGTNTPETFWGIRMKGYSAGLGLSIDVPWTRGRPLYTVLRR